MKTIQCKPIYANEDGWTDWQKPKMKGYLMQCCDCGLIHEMEFGVIKVIRKTKNGWKTHVGAGKEYEVTFRMRRRSKA